MLFAYHITFAFKGTREKRLLLLPGGANLNKFYYSLVYIELMLLLLLLLLRLLLLYY